MTHQLTTLKSVEEQIWTNAHSFPDKVALKSAKSAITYKELCGYICAARTLFLNAHFWQKGGTIVIAAGKQLGFVFAYFGAHLAKLKVVPIDEETNQRRFSYILKTVEPICGHWFRQARGAMPKTLTEDF